jgi:hypothetical protein
MAANWKTVHIFISSTFLGMHAERDYLVKQLYPQLREGCEKRKMRPVNIDLRYESAGTSSSISQKDVWYV